MNRSAHERFGDFLLAIGRCRTYRVHLMGEDDELAAKAFDAILRNLAVIGEAVRALYEGNDRIDPDLIADIVDNYLEQLAKALQD